MVSAIGRSSLREGAVRPRGYGSRAVNSGGRPAGCAGGHGVLAENADHSRSAGRRGWRGLRAPCYRDPRRAAEAGNAKGDATAGPAEQGGDGQDPAAIGGHSAGGSDHTGERGLEEELDG
uniref:Uncharacterized protein n=1 Tax=Macaca fascicularis TaxID=9541 RepID=A0A7N9DHU3_MACFA